MIINLEISLIQIFGKVILTQITNTLKRKKKETSFWVNDTQTFLCFIIKILERGDNRLFQTFKTQSLSVH